MKSLSLLKNKTFLIFWLVYHVGIVGLFALLMLVGKRSINIDADLFNMLPNPVASEAISAADEKLTEITGKNVFILVSNTNYEKCLETADKVYQELKDSSKFKSFTLYQDTNSAKSMTELLEQYKFHLLDENTINSINDSPEDYQMEAYEKAATGFFPSAVTEDDPFGITGTVLLSYLDKIQNSGTKMTINKDNVMTSQVDEKHYIMLRGVLSPEGAALASKGNAVVKIHEVCDPLEGVDGNHFVYSGTPYHSYKSSSNASMEITIISAVSLIVVLVILLLIFKRPHPILWSLLSIGISILIAICATFIMFKKMHILTLVFGTSLIGSCIDYSLHFFINWRGNTDLNTGKEIRDHMFKGLFLSLMSTCLCYIVLLFAPFNLIKQMAIFSTTGIISTFLTAICVYPFIKVPQDNRRIRLVKIMKTPDWYNQKLVGRIVISGLFVASIGIILGCWINEEIKSQNAEKELIAETPDYIKLESSATETLIHKLHIKNDLRTLYKMEGEELENEKEANRVLQYSPGGWFIVSGDSPEEVLQVEEKVSAKLKKVNEGKEKGGFMCASIFIPSQAKQKASYEAIEKLIPLADEQSEYMGFNSSAGFKKAFKNQKDKYFNIEDIFCEETENSKDSTIKAAIRSLLENYWLGLLANGKYYSVILPVSVTSRPAYLQIADEVSKDIRAEKIAAGQIDETEEIKDPAVFYIQKVDDINKELDNLTFTILVAFLIVYVVLFALLKFFYSWKQTFKITSVPLLIILVTVAIFYAFGIHIEFFSVTGMILVFGLGLDYIIYMIENEKREKDNDDTNENSMLEPFAITLSFVTTAVSFGALALSQFIPVHMIGLAIFIGLSTAFCSTFFYQRAEF